MSTQKHVYAVFGARVNQDLDDRILTKFTEVDRRQLSSGQWLVRSLADRASGAYEQIRGNESSNIMCIVTSVKDYYGWQDAVIWDWVGRNDPL